MIKTETQSEALRLARLFETECATLHDGYAAARLLRRLDAENQSFKAGFSAIRDVLILPSHSAKTGDAA